MALTPTLPPISPTVWLALLLGAGVVVAATAQAVRSRHPGMAVSWLAVAGLGQAMLALGATGQDPAGLGPRAAMLQVVAVAASFGLAWVVGPGDQGGREAEVAGDWEAAGRNADPLARLARVVAWASLVGAPGLVGFHCRLILLACLLDLGWVWPAALVLAAAWAGAWAAVRAGGGLSTRPLHSFRRALAAALAAGLLVGGFYPHWALVVADWLARVAFS